MKRFHWATPIFFGILIGITLSSATLTPPDALAEEAGTFEGTLNASGKRQVLEFAEERRVFTFFLEGHVNLTNAVGETRDFWAEWIGFWDTKSGGVVRCVWKDLKGEKIYVALTGTQMQEGATLNGEFIDGTGKFKGIQGGFRFTWTSVSFDTGDQVTAGYAKDIQGTYRIP